MLHVDQQSFERCEAVASPVWGTADQVSTDGLLEGMLGAGLGLSAIRAFLGWSFDDLCRELEKRGVGLTAEQRDKPLRLRKNGWSIEDHRRFIAGWVGGASVSVLAERLQRSKSSLYWKRRRLGLPGRKRVRSQASVMADGAIGSTEAAPVLGSPLVADAPEPPTQDVVPDWEIEESASPGQPQEAVPIGLGTRDVEETSSGPCERSPAPEKRAKQKTKKEKTSKRESNPAQLDPTLHPELCAAIDDFMTNVLPADVNQVRNYRTKEHVISSVALLGGMSQEAISAATGFRKARVNGHIDRSHLCGIPAKGKCFDVALYAEQLKLHPPECEPTRKRLVFHRDGEYREAVVVRRERKRRERELQKRFDKEHRLLAERAEWERSRNIVTRNGVSLPRLKCLEGPELTI